jgi:hypothetical protein
MLKARGTKIPFPGTDGSFREPEASLPDADFHNAAF